MEMSEAQALKIDAARRKREEEEHRAAELAAQQREAQRQENYKTSQRRIRERQIAEAESVLRAFEAAAESLAPVSRDALARYGQPARVSEMMGELPAATVIPMLLAGTVSYTRERIELLKAELAQFS